MWEIVVLYVIVLIAQLMQILMRPHSPHMVEKETQTSPEPRCSNHKRAKSAIKKPPHLQSTPKLKLCSRRNRRSLRTSLTTPPNASMPPQTPVSSTNKESASTSSTGRKKVRKPVSDCSGTPYQNCHKNWQRQEVDPLTGKRTTQLLCGFWIGPGQKDSCFKNRAVSRNGKQYCYAHRHGQEETGAPAEEIPPEEDPKSDEDISTEEADE